VYCFFSGTDAVNFVKQYDQFGLKQTTGSRRGLPDRADVLPAQGQVRARVITGHF